MRRLAVLLAVAAAAALPLAGSTHAAPEVPSVPDDIAVDAGHKLFLVAHAVGFQVHTCTAVTGGYAWRFDGPVADLYGDNGRLVGTHFGGPKWQARDGSTVAAGLDGRVTVDPTAIPWLRLKVTSAVAGAEGDRLAGTTYIQRIATTGGLTPAAGDCHGGTLGTTERVPYTADYAFWKAAS